MIADDFDPCPECGSDSDSFECGRDDRYECFQDPTPAEQWQVTTPEEVYA